VLNESIVTHFHRVLYLHNVYCGFEYRFRLNKVRFVLIRTLPVISKVCFTYFCPNRRIIVGFFIKLSDYVLKSIESLNKSKGAVNTHRNASSDGADDDDECSCDSNGRHSDGEDSDDEDVCGNFVFVMGDAAAADEAKEEEEEEAENIGELAVRDIARSLASREIVRAKYTGKPQESIYNAPLPLTKVSVRFHQTFGQIRSKRESENDNLQSTDESSDDSYTRRDLISKAISIAHEEIVSGRKVRIRDQKDGMMGYGMAKASRVSDSCLF
jgi:hypothetical protein